MVDEGVPGGPTGTAAPGAATAAAGDTPLARAIDRSLDLVVAFDETTTVTYVNDAASELLGHDVDDLVGRSIAEYVHPDDLTRAVEIVGLMGTDATVLPVTPAVFRIRTGDDRWMGLEVLGQRDPVSGHVVIIGRYSGDRELLEEILACLTSGRPPSEVLELVPRFGTWRHPEERYAVVLTDPDGERRVVGSQLPAGLDGTVPGGPVAEARRTRADVRIDVGDLPLSLREATEQASIASVWARPVDDPLTGEPAVLVATSSRLGAPSELHRYPLELMERALRLVLQWRQHLHTLERLALHDPLTGLANRTRFWAAVADTDHRGTVAVLYVDLDHFKPINDGHGHGVGDAVLVAAAQRLRSSLRPTDLVARLGGDEFAALCPGVTGTEEARLLAERVLHNVGQPVGVGEGEVALTCSVGVAVGPATEADALLHAADAAMYRAKRAGRARWELAGR